MFCGGYDLRGDLPLVLEGLVFGHCFALEPVRVDFGWDACHFVGLPPRIGFAFAVDVSDREYEWVDLSGGVSSSEEGVRVDVAISADSIFVLLRHLANVFGELIGWVLPSVDPG